MSRNYFVQVEILGTPNTDDVQFALEEIGVDDLQWYPSDGMIVAEGRTTLSGGQTEAQAHEQMRTALANPDGVQRLVSRWKCMGFVEWDVVVGGQG